MANNVIIRSKDKLQEISIKLEQSHLAYLQTDDSPLKLQQRNKLEGFIREYLCLVPNESKYVFQETADILHRSAATLTDFSGYRAATAWSAISLYAANLLAQPWRKEYRTVRTYSGYYKHEVEANLIGAELMFEQMGYKHSGLGILILEGPIDPDKVSNVSRDAIVAFVECQILKQIWESVSQGYTISWLEVLEFRENHVGTPEQAIRALNYRFLEKIHQNRTKIDSYKDYYPQQSDTNITPQLPYHHTIHTMHANYHGNTTMLPAYRTDYQRIEDSTNMVIPASYRYFQPVDQSYFNSCNNYGCLSNHGSKFYSGGVQPSPYCATLPAYVNRVPTDNNLIGLDMPMSVANYDKTHASRKSASRISDLDEVDFYRRQPSDVKDHYEHGKSDKKSDSSVGGDRKNDYDTWDFVYKNLESQGYYKNLDDRTNILQYRKELDSNRASKHKSLRQMENEDKHNAYSRCEKKRSNGRSEANEINLYETNGKNSQDTLSFTKKSSSFDLSDTNRYSIDSTYNKDKRHNSQTLPILHMHKSADQISRIADSLKHIDVAQVGGEKKKDEKKAEDGEKRWSCATCTYLNMPDRDICEMCAKSRCKGNEDKPLASGGKECPKCTLVNEKNVSICDACQTSLKDSPTYI